MTIPATIPKYNRIEEFKNKGKLSLRNKTIGTTKCINKKFHLNIKHKTANSQKAKKET